MKPFLNVALVILHLTQQYHRRLPTRIILFPLLLLFLLVPTINAAPPENLFKGHNPSFENGFTHWNWKDGVLPKFKIAKGHNIPGCGSHVLKIKQSNGFPPRLESPRVAIPEPGRYRLSAWMRVKNKPGEDAEIFKFGMRIKNSAGWQSGEVGIQPHELDFWTQKSFEMDSTESWDEAHLWFDLYNTSGGTILIDCAKIERIGE